MCPMDTAVCPLAVEGALASLARLPFACGAFADLRKFNFRENITTRAVSYSSPWPLQPFAVASPTHPRILAFHGILCTFADAWVNGHEGRPINLIPITMATGNFLLGYGRRSIGDVTFYRSGGKQRARARNRQPANPRSEKQSIQRMILATAAKMAAAYTPIVNHSWEGIQVGQPSVQHFRSLAMQALRTSAAKAINRDQNVTPAQFAIKGAPIVGCCEGIRISSGSLGVNGAVVTSGSVKYTIGEALAQSIATQEDYVRELKKLSLQPGDQLTLVVQSINMDNVVATFTMDGVNNANYAERVRFCRVVFVSELPENFSGALLTGSQFNPALIQESQGDIPSVGELTSGGNFLEFDCGDILDGAESVEMAGFIRSQKQLDGKFKYSNSYLKMSSSVLDDNNAPDIFPSYMNGVGEINVGDVLYLQHAVASPFETGE